MSLKSCSAQLVLDSFDRHDVWVDPELSAMGVKRHDQEHVLSSISEDLIKIANSKFNNVPEFMMKEVSDVSSLPWFEHPGKIKLSEYLRKPPIFSGPKIDESRFAITEISERTDPTVQDVFINSIHAKNE